MQMLRKKWHSQWITNAKEEAICSRSTKLSEKDHWGEGIWAWTKKTCEGVK